MKKLIFKKLIPKKPIFKEMSHQNTHELRQELARAHLVIALLSIIAIILLVLGTTLTVNFDMTLSTIAGVFLGILAVISLSMSYMLASYKQ